MNRLSVLLVALFVLVLPGIGRAAPTLRPSATVTGDVIRLGDLFADAGANAKLPVAASPPLGTHVTYSAAWLGAIAHEHNLAWVPSSDFDQATVERASRAIGADLVAQRVLDAIGPTTGASDADIRFDNPGLRLVVPAEASDAIAIDGLNYDQRSGRFSAFVSAPPGAADAQRQRVTGRVVIQVDVAVPNRAVQLNEILGKADIEQIKLPRDRVAADAITDAAQLIGKAPRHILRAGQPVRAGEVEDPVVVHKGDLVTIELRTATMELSTQGKALEDGAMGAFIRVANTQSNRTIDAVVSGPNLVRTTTSDKLAAR